MAQHLELSFPAKGDFLFLARLAVGAVAARVGLTVEELEDVHLAVDELCLLLIGPEEATDERLECSVGWDDDELSVRCRLLAGSGSAPGPRRGRFDDEFSERILDALVDDHGVSEVDGVPTGFLTKRRRVEQARG